MSWFKRSDKGILTPTEAKREVPDGLWFKSPAGKIVHTRELKKNAWGPAYGKMNSVDITIACMDFAFIGGSMGSVVGEKIARAMDHSLKKKKPFLMISRSGGARMMEAGLSLMQMAKTAAKIAQMDQAKVPYISLLTD